MTFDPFGDFETRGYLRNHFGLKERPDLAHIEFNNYRTVLPKALAHLEASALNYDDVLTVHDILFSAIYPWAGQDRSTTAPDIAITRGGLDDMFCHPADCRRAGNHALRETATPATFADRPGEAYSDLCHSHAFLVEFLNCLTTDLRSPNEGHLDKFLRQYLLPGARSLSDLQTMLVDRIRLHGL